MTIENAVEALKRGEPIMIYDSRERESEVDLVFPAWAVDEDAVYTLRTRAGGLICFVTDSSITRALGIPWGDELLLKHPPLDMLARKRLSYGDRPAFTIWVNYIGVKTGISDHDRSTTIRMLDKVVYMYLSEGRDSAFSFFYENFQAPGHVPILAARSMDERRGHTELAIAMARLAGLRPSMVIAEMLDRGHSLSYSKAEEISMKTGWPLISGDDIVEAAARG